jgi:chromosome segregation ATPase
LNLISLSEVLFSYIFTYCSDDLAWEPEEKLNICSEVSEKATQDFKSASTPTDTKPGEELMESDFVNTLLNAESVQSIPQSCSGEMASLIEQLQQSTAIVAQQGQYILELETKVAKQKQQLEDAEKKIEQLDCKVINLEDTIHDLSVDLAEGDEQVQSEMENKRICEQRINELSLQNDTLQCEHSSMKIQLQNAINKHNTLLGQYKQLQQQKQKLQQSNVDVITKLLQQKDEEHKLSMSRLQREYEERIEAMKPKDSFSLSRLKRHKDAEYEYHTPKAKPFELVDVDFLSDDDGH